MSQSRWYSTDLLAYEKQAEMRREAENERRARAAQGYQPQAPVLPRLLNWIRERLSRRPAAAPQAPECATC